jgi:hypothetical protein
MFHIPIMEETSMGKNSILKSTLSTLAAILLLSLRADAQWSPDSLLNLGIAVTIGEQTTPKMVATSDGGCYISWFDNRNGNYCMYLQRLNSLGEAQFAANGLLVSDHPQNTSLVDYGMAVDHNDNAVIVFTDIRNGGTNGLDVFAYKIGPDGSFLWGADGICLSAAVNSDYEPAPKVTATSEDNFVVGWGKSSTTYTICFQKISALGEKMWGEDGITLIGESGHRLQAPDLAPAGSDSVIAIWKNSTGSAWAPVTHLYTQKFDPNGNAAWDTSGVLIYDLGLITAWTYPLIYSDGHGGAFYTWQDSPSNAYTVRVQHVDAAGNLVFPLNGIVVSTNSADRLHMYPTLSYLPATDELFVFWAEENWNQNQYGIYGQKFSPTGVRLWTDNGGEFIGLGSIELFMIRSMPAAGSIYVGYFESQTQVNRAVKAFRIDPDGIMFWSPRVLSSASLGDKGSLQMVVNTENRAFTTWWDDRNGDFDIYAQDVNSDGSLGNQIMPCVHDLMIILVSGTDELQDVLLSWTAVPGAQQYRIYKSNTDPSSGFVQIGSTTDITFTDNDALVGESKSFYYVTADNEP